MSVVSSSTNRRTNVWNFLMIVLAALALTLGTAGCGDDDGGGGNNGGSTSNGSGDNTSGGDSTTGGTTTETAYCCLNGSFYDCPDGDASRACVDNFDPGSCVADSSRNSECSSGSDDPGTDPGTDPGGDGGGGDGSGSIGDQCEYNDDCASNACLVRDGATFGYCTTTCDSFTECPTFWSCEHVGNASSKYCVQ